MVDGVRVCVPDDLEIVTPYVLIEQQDWFEDEIRFVRACMTPGMRAIDAGANFGVYALALARCVGSAGRVWAIEPAEDTAGYLARSIVENGFQNIDLIRCALSSADGTGSLELSVRPELRSLANGAGGAEVVVRSLDSLSREHAIGEIAFVKIDVEGEEARVLAGGAGFFARENPLVMLELKHDKAVNVGIFEPLAKHGYDFFRLLPGINVLVPFYESEEVEPYHINVFACKPARAAAMSASGYLVTEIPDVEPAIAIMPDLNMLCARPYAKDLCGRWRVWAAAASATEADYLRSLYLYLAAQQLSNSVAARYRAIEQSYTLLRALLRERFTAECGASFVRVAAASGRRAEAVNVCRQLAKAVASSTDGVLDAPLLAPWREQENIAVGTNPREWLAASAIEAYENLNHFSSYYKAKLAHEELGLRTDPRFLSPAYARRQQLMEQRSKPK